MWNEGVGIFGTARIVVNSAELEREFENIIQQTGEAPLIQPLIQGDEYGVEMIADSGRVYARAVHRRIRSMSPRGGASVVKETVSENELTTRMCWHAVALVEKLSWSGPIMVEFKVDKTINKPLLLAINGRFWGSLPLAIAAGVDMPFLWHQRVRGISEDSEIIISRAGVRTFHFLGEVRWLLQVLFARDTLRSLLYPSRISALIAFLTPSLGAKSDTFRLSDLKPGIMEYIDVVFSHMNKK